MTAYFGSSKIKDTGAYGVYLGSPNTNCLTYTPKNINLTLDPLNVNIVGSPTINNGVASGFSGSNWLRLPKIFNPSSNTWEMVIKARTPSAFSKRNWLTGGGNTAGKDFDAVAIGLENNGKPLMYITSNGTSWNIANGVAGNNTLAVNTDYLFRCQFTGTQYIYSTSVDNGSTWTTQITINSTAKIFVQTSTQAIGTSSYQANAPEFWTGSIDLSQSYIKINGSTWWKGGTGHLTLKKGSKVYVPNGKNADGSLKFDEVVIESDRVIAPYETPANNIMLFAHKHATSRLHKDQCTSGNTYTFVSANWTFWYDTANNKIKLSSDGGVTWDSDGWSLPLGIASCSTANTWTSIDQTFDWCGYIGSTAFVLPGVKGLIPNGFNADGTYKNAMLNTDRVLTYDFSIWGTANSTLYINVDQAFAPWNSVDIFTQETLPNRDYSHVYIPSENKYWWKDVGDYMRAMDCPCGTLTVTSGRITSLTPYTAQPSTTVIPIKEIYNGSELVYQYKQPGEVLFEKSTAGTYTFTAPYNATVDVVLVGGGGGGSDSWGGNGRTGGSAGMVTGSITITRGTTYTIVVGGGGAYGYGSAVDKAGQGATGGTTSAFGNNAYGGAGGYTHTGWGAVIANNGAGGGFSVVSGFTGSNGVEGSTANRYGNYGGGGFGSANGAGGYVRITVKG